jgi:intein/homing endonuclease
MQPLDSLVYTPKGPIRMGDVKIGTTVSTPNGKTAPVTNIIPHGIQDVYRIHLSDGTYVDSGKDHEWEIYTALGSKGSRLTRKLQRGNVVKTTEEILNTYIYKYSDKAEFRYKLNPVKPVEHSANTLPIDPYLMGVLLGDGSLSTGEITSADEEIITTIQKRTGFELKRVSETKSKAKRYFLDFGKEYLPDLESLGLTNKKSHTKFIPDIYKYSSVEQRLWLLRGLMDTDGHAERNKNGSAEFCTVSKQLTHDVADLARSLGCKVSVKESDACYTLDGVRKVTGTRYRAHITVPAELNIFNLERKNCVGLPERYLRRTIVKVEKLDSRVEMQCITVGDEDHLYITDNYTPTHNCLDKNSFIVDADTLRPIRLKDVKDNFNTVTYNLNSNKPENSGASLSIPIYKNCVKFRLESGVSLTPSLDHLVYEKKSGWIPASEIKIGDQILAFSSYEHGVNTVTDEELEDIANFTISKNHIPDVVFNFDYLTLKNYFKILFVNYGRLDHKQKNITLSIFNKPFAFDLQHLLLRFNIFCRVTKDGLIRIDDSLDADLFLRDILDLDVAIHEAKNPRRWELVVNITNAGIREVYDIILKDNCNFSFSANNVVVHNSFCFSVLALWHAVTREGKAIHVFAPSSTQILEFFKAIDDWIGANPLLKEFVHPVGNSSAPMKRTFITGSTIHGHILGVNGTAPDKLRGITADVVFVDEGQGLSDEDWRVIKPIMRGDLTRRKSIRTYVAGTLNKAEGEYYEKIEKNLKKSKNETIIKIPITENEEWDFDMIEEERIAVNSEATWTTEYLLEVAEEDSAVFKKEDIDNVFKYDWEPSMEQVHPHNPIFLTVDWDKVQCGTNILISQYDPYLKNLKFIWHEEISKGEWTYTLAVNRIVELFEVFNPTLVIIDQGASEKQWEDLNSIALLRPELGLAQKLTRLAFQSNVVVPDQLTGEDRKIKVKPYLVELLRAKTQQSLLMIPKNREDIQKQFLDYKVIKTTANTVKFTSKNEHIIDCFLFAMFGIFTLFENPYTMTNESLDNFGVIAVPSEEDAVRQIKNNMLNMDLDEFEAVDFLYSRSSLDDSIYGYERDNF